MRRSSYRRLRRTVYHYLNQQEQTQQAHLNNIQKDSNKNEDQSGNIGCFPAIMFFIVLLSVGFIFFYIYQNQDPKLAFDAKKTFYNLFFIFTISSGIVPLLLINILNNKNKKKIIIILIIIFTVILIVGLIIASIPPKHECIFESLGHSTTTCQHLGTTVYECYYKESLGCKKIKVVQDTQYAECSYFQEVVSDKIDITIVKNTCRNCGNVYMEEVKNSYGTWGDDTIIDTGKYGDTFHATVVRRKEPYKTYMYAVLYFFDKDGNKIGYWYRNISLSDGIISVRANLENELPSNYYEHRWDLQSYEKIGEPNTFIPVK